MGRFSLKQLLNPVAHTKAVIADPFNPVAHTTTALGIKPKEPDAPAKPKVFAMPDQEEQKRIGRRNAAKRRGGRTSTILTGQDTLG